MITGMQFASQSLVHAMGWTLLHFCWEGAAVALVLWCALGLLPARWPRARYGATCLALVLMMALPVATFVRLAAETPRVAIALPELRMETVVLSVAVDNPHAEPWGALIANGLDEAASWVPGVWLAGVLLFLGRLNLCLAAARRMKTIGTQATPNELQSLLSQIADRLRIRRAVQLMHSAAVQVPTVVGWLRPVILLPVGCFAGLSQAQMETLLAHELAHIRRHDYLVSIFQSIVEALLFYHPAVWWVSRQVRQERECCCDELAVGVGGDRLAYARALSFLEERRAASPEIVLGANGGVLTIRIRRLLQLKSNAVASQAAAMVLLGVFLAIAGTYLVTVARAQPKVTRASATEAARPAGSIQAAAPVGAGVEALQAKPEVSRLAELDRKVQAGKDTVTFLERELRLLKQNDARLPQKALRFQEQILQSKVDQARQMFQEDYRELVATGNSEPTPAQVATANSSDDLGMARGVYKTWLDEDVRWIITGLERQAFLHLSNDEERDMFITQFWARRDPPGSPGSFKEMHYERIAYTNQHFATPNVPGWKSDLGHIYIAYGKPDSIDSHPSGGQYQKPGGQSTTMSYPFEVWHYQSIPGLGENVDFNFVDTCRCGEYHYTIDRTEKDLLASPDRAARAAKVLRPPAIPREASYKPAMSNDAELQAVLPIVNAPFRIPYAYKPLRLDSSLPTGGAQMGDAAPRGGAISGNVTDMAGAPIRGAALRATNTDTGAQMKRVSDESGGYSCSYLPAGNYNVEVEADGFFRLLQENVRVETGKSVGLNLRLTTDPSARTVSIRIAPRPGMQVGSNTPDAALLQNGLQAIKQGRYDAGRMDLQTLINTYPDSQLVQRARLAIAASWEKQGGTAALAEADKEYAETGIVLRRIGGGVTPPQVIFAPDPKFSEEARKAKQSGIVTINLWVDQDGNPQHVRVRRSAGNLLDEKAIEAVRQYKFKPAMENDKPVVVELNIEVNFQFVDKAQSQPPVPQNNNQSPPLQAGGNHLSPPVLIHSVPPEYTEQARIDKFSGIVVVALAVDKRGKPTNVHVVRSVGEGLDAKAIEAVSQYRFKPATKDGKPTASVLNVEVNFRIF